MTISKTRLNSTTTNHRTASAATDTYRRVLVVVVIGVLINICMYYIPRFLPLSPMLSGTLVHSLPLVLAFLLLTERTIRARFSVVRFGVPVLLFMVLVLAALLHQMPFLSLRKAIIVGMRFVTFVALYAGFCQLSPAKRLRIIAVGCFIVVMVGFVTARLNVFLIHSFDTSYIIESMGYRPKEIWAMGIVPRSSAAFAGGMLFLASYFLFINKRDKSIKLVNNLGLIVMGIMGLVPIIGGGARTALIGVVGAMLLSTFLLNSTMSPGKLLRSLIRILMICGILGAAYQVTEIMTDKERIWSMWQRRDSSIGARLEIWESAIDAIVDHPLVGWGPTNAPYKLAGFTRRDIPNAHNEILTVMAEWGVMVAGLLIILFYRMIKYAQVFRDEWKIALLSYFLIGGIAWPLLMQYYGADAFLFGVMLAAISVKEDK